MYNYIRTIELEFQCNSFNMCYFYALCRYMIFNNPVGDSIQKKNK